MRSHALFPFPSMTFSSLSFPFPSIPIHSLPFSFVCMLVHSFDRWFSSFVCPHTQTFGWLAGQSVSQSPFTFLSIKSFLSHLRVSEVKLRWPNEKREEKRKRTVEKWSPGHSFYQKKNRHLFFSSGLYVDNGTITTTCMKLNSLSQKG